MASDPRADVGVASTAAGAGEPGKPIGAGTRIGRFVVIERLGAGGMGEVYACHDPELDRRVAVKLLHAAGGAAANEPLMLRLRREAQAAAKLSHRHVVTVYDVGIAELDERAEVFVAMELVDGGTLEDWATARPRRWDEIVAKYLEAGRGLAAAHSAGIVHRDFKPTNVLVARDGDAKVSDFGLATSDDRPATPGVGARAAGTGALTRTGAVMGTPMFMAPEQRDGARVDARADLYAFCVALFRAVHGVHPFGETADEIAVNAAAHRVAEPRRRAPAALLRILRAGLEPDPDRRPARLATVLADLERLIARRPRRATVAAIAAAGLAIAVVLVVIAISRTRGGGPAVPCAGARTEMATTWGPAQRAALARAFATSGSEFAADAAGRATEQLDRWSDRWVDTHVEACRATRVDGSQSERALDLRIACLRRQRDELATLVAFLDAGDAGTVVHATELARGLPPVEACGDPAETSEPEDAELAALTRRLGEAELTFRSGRYADGIAIATEVLDAARERGARPLIARAALVLGQLQTWNGDPEPGREHLFQAALDAQVTGQPKIAARAWIGTIELLTLGHRPADEEEARAYAQAGSALEAVDDDPLLEAQLLQAHASYLNEVGNDSAAAVPLFRKALEILSRQGGPDQPLLPSVMDSLGNALRHVGQPAEGLQLERDALALRERLFGPEHPDVARSLHNIANAVARNGRSDEAEPLFRRSLDLKIRTLGPNHPAVSNTLIELALMLLVDGRHAEAIELYRRDLALWTVVDSGPEDLAGARRSLATALLVAGQHAEALALYAEAQALYLTSEDAEQRAQAVRLNTQMAWPRVALGQLREAEAGLQEVAELLAGRAPEDLPITLFVSRAHVALTRHRLADARRELAGADAALAKHPDAGPTVEAQVVMLHAELRAAEGDRAGASVLARKAQDLCARLQCRQVSALVRIRARAIGN